MHYLLSFIFIFSSAFALINEPIHSQIISISQDKEHIFIKPIEGAELGMYGVIVQSFDETHTTALSWVEVLSINAESIEVKSIPIKALEQSALPSGTWMPKNGDKVILGYNYHRALLISPNASTYKKVTHENRQYHWVHPDIFAAVLASNGHPTPLQEDFKNACRANNIGTVGFIFDNSIVTVDCQSFKIIKVKKTDYKISDLQLPFYTRVNNIEANWFGKGSDELLSFAPYYANLLAENNPDNDWIQTYSKTLTQGE